MLQRNLIDKRTALPRRNGVKIYALVNFEIGVHYSPGKKRSGDGGEKFTKQSAQWALH